MPVLLVVDDDPIWLCMFRDLFQEPDIALLTASSAREGLEVIARTRPDVVLLDVGLPDESGLEAFRRIHEVDERIPIIFVTGQGTTETAIQAMQLGGYDYLLKDRLVEPAERGQLLELVERAFHISRLMHVPAVLSGEALPAGPADVLVGRCAAMQEVYKAIGRVAAQDLTVLILGESGTGKELVARAIYQHSRRSTGPFLAINCAAIPETLLESELFGHEKGAFTGAERRRIGKFEQCSGGTLFLDEIGDMTPLTQSKILRVLQEQRFERVGGNETIQTDVRVLAATHRDVKKLVDEGTFRGDLYYRLSVFSIHLPPLRERKEDLPALVEHFLKRFNRELGKDVRQAAPEALDILRAYAWPGNLRELQSVLKQALLQATGPMLLPEFLPDSLHGQEATKEPAAPVEFPDWRHWIREQLRAGSENLNADAQAIMERILLTEVLNHTGGNQVQAARILGITRNSLRFKIRSLNIKIERAIRSTDHQDE